MKILVTGGRGFVGKKISQKLFELGHNVETLSRSNTGCFDTKIRHHNLDLSQKINDTKIFEGVDCIIHTAAKAGVDGNFGDYYSANFIGTMNLLQASKANDVKFFIHTSSPSVVFSGRAIRYGKEDMPYISSRISPYSYTKSIAEKKVLSSNRDDFVTVALRPHLIWGENDPHLLPKVINRHRMGNLKIVGNGLNKVDLTHIDNVVHAHILALDALISGKPIGGRAYFISQNEPVVLWNWLNSIFKTVGLDAVKNNLSFPKAYMVGAFAEFLWKVLPIKSDLPMSRFVACQLAHDHWFSTEAAKRDFGYEPILSMKEALDKTIPWLKSLN